MKNNFVNYHVLISHSPSCLNRDDMNMQKTAVFGGVKRVRISSQSLKHAMRKDVEFQKSFGASSIRTRSLNFLVEKLEEVFQEKYNSQIITGAVEKWISKKIDDAGIAVAPWCVEEVEELIKLLQAEPELDEKKLRKHINLFGKALENAMDIALFGRMTTAGLMLPVDGALAMAHAITTHQAEPDIDWFTAVDDLVADAGETGAGHLNTQEFSAGVFYRYASLNLGQLQKNLGNASQEKVLEIASEVFRLMATVVPQAKQQPFAAFNRSDFSLVTFSDQPISLANAFETPIRSSNGSGYFGRSVQELMKHWQQIQEGYELDDQAAILDIRQMYEPSKPEKLEKISALQKWICRGGRW